MPLMNILYMILPLSTSSLSRTSGKCPIRLSKSFGPECLPVSLKTALAPLSPIGALSKNFKRTFAYKDHKALSLVVRHLSTQLKGSEDVINKKGIWSVL
jgi:hypothetical protein